MLPVQFHGCFTPVVFYRVFLSKDCEAHWTVTATGTLGNSNGSECDFYFPVYTSFIKFCFNHNNLIFYIQKNPPNKATALQNTCYLSHLLHPAHCWTSLYILLACTQPVQSFFARRPRGSRRFQEVARDLCWALKSAETRLWGRFERCCADKGEGGGG